MTRPSRRVRQLTPINVDYQSEAGVDNGADGIDWDTGDFTPILTPFGVPAIDYGTPAAGTDLTAIRTDATIAPPDLDELGQVNVTAPANGDVLTYDSTPGEWVAAAPTGGGVVISSNVPVQDGGSGSAGTGTDASADDHKHPGDKVAIVFVIDGGGATITTGVKGDLSIPFGCTITAARLLADQSGAIVVDVWKDTYANYPPVIGDTITASAPPTITASGVKSDDTTLTGWTTAIAAGDTLRFNVNSVTTIQRVTLTLTATRT